jgi:hypothetical protein
MHASVRRRTQSRGARQHRAQRQLLGFNEVVIVATIVVVVVIVPVAVWVKHEIPYLLHHSPAEFHYQPNVSCPEPKTTLSRYMSQRHGLARLFQQPLPVNRRSAPLNPPRRDFPAKAQITPPIWMPKGRISSFRRSALLKPLRH